MTNLRINNRNTRGYYPSVFNNVFESFLDGADWGDAATHVLKPKTNVLEQEQAFVIEFAIPGYQKADVEIKLEGDVLTVTGKKQAEDVVGKWTRKEFSYGEFSRSFSLSDNLNQELVEAAFDNGILSITLPKKEQVKPTVKNIEIQ